MNRPLPAPSFTLDPESQAMNKPQQIHDAITQATTLPYTIPVSGANSVDAAIIANRIRLAADLYKSAVIGLTGHYQSAVRELIGKYDENLPMDRRVTDALRCFTQATDEVSDDLQGAVEGATE